MFRLRLAAGEQDIAAKSDRGEERLHALIVGLAPAIERVMMALGTGDAQAEKNLRQRAGPVARFGYDLVEVGRAMFGQGSLGGEDLAGKLVQRLVPGNAIANPAIEAVCALVAQDLAIHAQEVGPLERPVVGKFGPLQKLI